MADLRALKTDLTKGEDGIWATYPGTNVRCRIARITNSRFRQEALRLKRTAKMQAVAEGDFTSREAKIAVVPAIAKTILLEWTDLSEDGVPIPYSQQKAQELLAMPELEDFYDWVLSVSGNAELFRLEDLEADSGN